MVVSLSANDYIKHKISKRKEVYRICVKRTWNVCTHMHTRSNEANL